MQKATLGGTRVAQRAGTARAARARVVSCSASKVNKVVLAYSGGEWRQLATNEWSLSHCAAEAVLAIQHWWRCSIELNGVGSRPVSIVVDGLALQLLCPPGCRPGHFREWGFGSALEAVCNHPVLMHFGSQ